jgi:hypothetical protein
MSRNAISNEKQRKRQHWAWYFYDFGNSAYAAVILLAVYSAYFKGQVVGGAEGSRLWGLAIGSAMLVVATLSPFLGALADLRLRRTCRRNRETRRDPQHLPGRWQLGHRFETTPAWHCLPGNAYRSSSPPGEVLRVHPGILFAGWGQTRSLHDKHRKTHWTLQRPRHRARPSAATG